MEKISISSDHAGYELKEKILLLLKDMGLEYVDCGTFSEDSVDYPDYAAEVAEDVSTGTANRGILICGSGIGMSITANKFPGVRAALCHDVETAKLSRKHNDANILIIGGRVTNHNMAAEMLIEWLKTDFDGGRHQGRLDKIKKIEEKNMKHLGNPA